MIKIGKDIQKVNKNDVDFNISKSNKPFLHNYQNVETLEEVNNIKEVLINLDKDVVQEDNLTTIDFNTRLSHSEISSIVALQLLHTLKVGGKPCSLITRSIKRHKVSLGGMGRTEKVQIIQGERNHEESGSTNNLFGKIKGFMGGNKDGQN